MKYYKDKNNEIYAYEDDLSNEVLSKSVEKFCLTPLSQKEIEEYLAPNVDEKTKQLSEIESEIAECENYIRHALIIGNTAVLESLRAEYKELIAEREKLNVTSEPVTVAPTDHL